MTLGAGDTVEGRYKIVKELDRGGMGSVYLAEHTLIKRRVALKLLRPDLAQDGNVLERFMNEARAAGMLGHPNIVESTDMGFTRDGVPYIVFELLEGSLLTDEIYRTHGLPVRRTLRIARQIASALYAAHSAGVVHRDLKSDNIFLTDREDAADHVKVLDFGVSQFIGVDDRETRGMMVGTPQFMAPEQITAPDKVDRRADVYALGVIIYEMLAARRPFEHDDDPNVVFERILHDAPAAMNVPGLPPGLEVLIYERFIAKNPDQRFPTMRDAEGALAAFAGIIRPSGRDSVPIAALPVPTAGETANNIVSMPPTQARRAPVGWLVAAVLAAAAGVVLAARAPAATAPTAAGPDATAVRDDAGRLAGAIDAASRAAQLRADGLAQTPMLRAAIVTDTKTVDDMLRSEFSLKLGPGEAFEMAQQRGDQRVVLAHVPHGDPLPVRDGHPALHVAGGGLAVVVSSPVQGPDGKPAGTVTLSVPVDVAPIRTQIAGHAISATVHGLGADLALVQAVGSGSPVEATIDLPKDLSGTATLAETLPVAETDAASGGGYRYGAYAGWAGAGIFAVIYAMGLLRARRRV
jgi:tRNA A-37 threonylcarbamoyl transferase component Bud32